jgi:DedD protein
MDKVLKQRLIGATILIALAVIFLPMLFDAPEEERLSRDMTIDLPEPPTDRPQVRRMPLDAEQARQPQDSTAEVPPRTIEPEIPDPEPELDPAPAVPEVDPDLQAEPESEPIEEPMVEPEPVTEPVPEAEPLPEPEPEPSPQPELTEGWMVQVASFGSESTARGIAERLDGLGHAVVLDRLVRGEVELHRVRTGPYISRAEAERARDQIARTVTGVDPVVRRGEAARAEEMGSGYAVQVGSFASRDNALALLARLEEHGFEGFIHSEEVGSRTIHRVRAGLSETREQAEQILDELLERAGLEGLVVSHP